MNLIRSRKNCAYPMLAVRFALVRNQNATYTELDNAINVSRNYQKQTDC